jgi:flagellar hook-length control protein FliK
MPVNLNPPPLPTPESARSVQSLQPVEEPQASDLFAQLVAAATSSKAPAAIVASDAGAAEDKSRDGEAIRSDAAQTDWMLALGTLPLAAPLATPVETSRPRAGDDATARTVAPRIARQAGRPDADVVPPAVAKPDDVNAFAATEVPRAAASTALREHLAAALAPRADAQPSPPSAASLAAKDKAPRSAHSESMTSNTGATPAHAPLAIALAAAVEHERASAAPREQAPAAEAASNVLGPLSAPASTTSATPAAVVTIDTPVGAPGFGNEIAAKLAHVVLRHDRAELRLSPADLGPVDIRIDLRNDSASLTIVAAQPATREALEQALPQLRESLAAQGIALGQAAINDGRAQSERRPDASGLLSPRAAIADDDAPPVIATRTLRLSDRLVDTFA